MERTKLERMFFYLVGAIEARFPLADPRRVRGVAVELVLWRTIGEGIAGSANVQPEVYVKRPRV